MVVTKPADLLCPYAERFHIDLSKVKSVERLWMKNADISANFEDNKADKLSLKIWKKQSRKRKSVKKKRLFR